MVMRRLLQLNKLRRTVITLGGAMNAVLVSIHLRFLLLCIILGFDAQPFVVNTVTVILR